MRALISLGLLLALALALLNDETGVLAWWTLRSDLLRADARISALNVELEGLERDAQALESDPFAIEKAIREDLELARPGEVIVRLASRDGIDSTH